MLVDIVVFPFNYIACSSIEAFLMPYAMIVNIVVFAFNNIACSLI